MADNFYAGNGNLATKRLPAPTPPTYSPFEQDAGSAARGLAGYISRGYNAVAPVVSGAATNVANAARVGGAYFGGDRPSLNAALATYNAPSEAAPAAPAPAANMDLMRGRNPAQGHAAVAANALAAANGAPRAHSISVEYGGNPNPRVFNFNADGSPAPSPAPAPAPAPAMPKLDFSKMTPGQAANAYMQPGVPHKAMRDAYAMSALNNPHTQMAGRYYELVSKLIASGIDPMNLPKGSLYAGELAAMREGMAPGYYQTDRTLGMPQ